MKTANRIPRCLSDIAAALCIAVAAGSAQAGPLVDQDVPAQVDGKLPSERVAAVQAPIVRTRLAPAGVDRDFLLFDAAVAETDPAELPVRMVEVLDDATIARGGSRGLPVAQVPVYLQLDSCLRGHFLTDDDTSGLGTWFAQASFDCPTSFPCYPKGWQAGDAITGYEVSYFFCSSASANNCSVEVELWDGDPHGVVDTVCNPTPAPIAGTKTTFSGLARAYLHNLRAQLPAPVTYNCDRVWIVVSMIEGCRASWLLGGWDYGCWEDPADIGWADGYGAFVGCQQFGSCNTPSGYNAGTCCTTGEACDYTDADPTNWTGDCQEGGAWPPDCPSHCLGYFTHPTYCSDGYADYFFTRYAGAPARYYAQPGAVYAATDKYIALLPVSADAPPDQNPTPDGWRVSGNEIILEAGDRPVWLEIRISDLDPGGPGIRIKGWQVNLDSSGYMSGLVGTLAPWSPPCRTDADCEALMGPLGHLWGCARGGCWATGWPSGSCIPAWIDNLRTDYIMAYTAESCAVDVSTLDFRYGSSAPSFTCPDYEAYAGTLVLWVPGEAKGTFTIGFDRRWGGYVKEECGLPVPMLGFIPAKITVEIGSCCYQLGGQDPPCVDGMTRRDCDALPGPRVFTPGGSCADGCPEPGGCCLPDYSCEEMLPQQCAEQGGWVVDECLGDLDGNGLDDACPLEPIPTVSAWGLIIMALVLAVAAKVYFARRPTVSANS